jgi:hypothetical protein
LPHISVSKTLGFAFSFSVRNAAAIAGRIALPALVGWIAFYASIFLYLTELERYLNGPSDRIASLILGLATGGLLVTVFLHSVIVAAVAALALGLEDSGWKFFHIARREWRLYAANLRMLLVAAIWVGATQTLQFAAAKLSWPVQFGLAISLLTAGGLGLLAVRVWFLAAPVSVAKTKGQILRRSWRLSAGNAWRLAAIVAVLALTGFAVEATAEFVLHAGGLIPPLPDSASLADYAALYRKILPDVLIAVAIAYLIGSVLLTAARVYVYRRLTEQTEP